MQLKSVAWTEQGRRSSENEDAFLAMPDQGVFALADGVGGGENSGKAARLLMEYICTQLSGTEITHERILKSIEAANFSIYRMSQQPGHTGMACTLVLAWITEQRVYCHYVGDSRIYGYRNGHLVQLTEDHASLTTHQEQRPQNTITRAVGVLPRVQVDSKSYSWREEDQLLLTSDGVSDQVGEIEICRILEDPDLMAMDRVRQLIELSNERGGRDDKTALYVF